MTVASGLAILPSIMIGIAVVQLLTPEGGVDRILLKLFLGTGLGVGISSCLFYFWRLVFPDLHTGYFYFELLILILLWVTVFWRGFPGLVSEKWNKIKLKSKLLWFLSAALAGIAVIAGMSFIAHQEANPHGAYDAWAIWNLHARMLFRGGEFWQSGFSIHLYHADYPLLLPASIARVWYLLQEETYRTSMLLPVVFVVSMVGLMFSVILIGRSVFQALLAVIVLTGTAWFVEVASIQYADMPLAWYVLATGSLLYLFFRSHGKNKGFLVLGGMSVGMASWTKNEGILFLVVVTVIVFITIWFSYKYERRSHFLRYLFAYIMGLSLPLGALISFKLVLAPPNDLVSGQNMGWVVQALTNVDRYLEVFQYLSAVIFDTWQIWLLVGILIYLLGAGPDVRIAAEGTSLRVTLTIFCVMLAAVVGIYILSPWTPEIHIRTSAGRVLLQIYPLFVLNIFLISADLGDLMESLKLTSKRNLPHAANN
jgi:hypothetical protein